jgi:hypothetical protein
VLTECPACGEPLFEYIKVCPRCAAPNPTYREDESDPKARMPRMERAAATIAAMSFVLTFVFGMAAASHFPGAVPRELKRLFTTALLVSLSGGLFIVLGDRLSGRAKRIILLVISGGYIALMVLAR